MKDGFAAQYRIPRDTTIHQTTVHRIAKQNSVSEKPPFVPMMAKQKIRPKEIKQHPTKQNITKQNKKTYRKHGEGVIAFRAEQHMTKQDTTVQHKTIHNSTAQNNTLQGKNSISRFHHACEHEVTTTVVGSGEGLQGLSQYMTK